ncbi:GGDEF domain-containing protein [Blastococcus sp. TML/C7B]|uniref:GGDEF domain-containing protein n=1 Tax=Blastococcus sp. TML/C7B TaxID=2798728 RepID=UPI00190DDB40|nr:GGDEF domain-containing protein [Blastococcus sp. TML/C7B]MBN1096486.1 GGDEF domain-containing protein [Blastococcus sp. TML/C7B]
MDRPHGAPAVPLLAALYLVSGALCLAGAAWPVNPDAPVQLLWVLGCTGVGVGGVLALLRDELPAWAVDAGLFLMSLLIGVLAWRSVTQAGVVGLGPVMIAVALYAAHVLPLPAARVHAVVLVTATSAGAAAAAPSGFLPAWVALVVAVLALTEVQGRLARQLRDAADTDPLTGVANRRAWQAATSRHLAHALRTGEPLTVAILDLDHFKLVNDRDGHSAGDALLRELTAGWTGRLRHADLLGRYGGDEFVLCLPATDEAGARDLVDRLREAHGFGWSAGLSTVRAGDTLDAVLRRADEDLYERKRAGRAC